MNRKLSLQLWVTREISVGVLVGYHLPAIIVQYNCTGLEVAMDSSISYSEARKNLKLVCDQVCEGREPVRITRRNGGNVVMLAEEEYNSLEETAYLMRSPANARRLLEAIARDREGVPGYSLESALSALNLDGEDSNAG
jgi:antitoxin YefM